MHHRKEGMVGRPKGNDRSPESNMVFSAIKAGNSKVKCLLSKNF